MSLLAAAAAPAPNGDRHYALSLRLLSLALSAALIGCVALLLWRWLAPAPEATHLVPLTQLPPRVAAAAPVPAAAAVGNQVLLAPGQIFRCVEGGRVSFGDRPCAAPR